MGVRLVTPHQEPVGARSETGAPGRVPPRDLAAEADVLGSVMLAGVECLDEVRSVVDVGDFFPPAACCDLLDPR